MFKTTSLTVLAMFALLTGQALAAQLQLQSEDLREGEPMHLRHVFNGFGCKGENLSPQLQWQHLPPGTQSIAVTLFDPDAPTGSGWWHWLALDLPATLQGLPRGADISKLQGRLVRNDAGGTGYGGACPPPGHGMHRYQFTVWALPMKKLELGADPSAALVGYMLNQQALARKTLTVTYHQ